MECLDHRCCARDSMQSCKAVVGLFWHICVPKQASYLEIPVCLQRKRLTDVNALSCHLGNLEFVYAVLVTVVAHL